MTTFIPSKADRHRALWVLAGMAGLLGVVLYLPLIKPWWQVETRISALRGRLSEAQQVRAKAPRISAEIATLRSQALTAGAYLPESSQALASAALTQRIQQATDAAASGDSVCVLGNRLPSSTENGEAGCEEVRVRVSMQCGTTALEKVLRGLEVDPPRLRIDRLEVNMAPNSLGFDRPAPANQPLNVSFDVVGCLLPSVLSTGDLGSAG